MSTLLTRAARPASCTRAQIAGFTDGFDLVEPCLVQAPLWRPDGKRPRAKDLARIGRYAGAGIKRS